MKKSNLAYFLAMVLILLPLSAEAQCPWWWPNCPWGSTTTTTVVTTTSSVSTTTSSVVTTTSSVSTTTTSVASTTTTSAGSTTTTSPVTTTIANYEVGNYQCSPLFTTVETPPNVLIVLDNSGSMNYMAQGYDIDGYYHPDDFNPATKYYGYFDPYANYTYTGTKFDRDGAGSWDGSFLNWLSMRRVDVARKVLVGGKASSRTGGGLTDLIGEDPAQDRQESSSNSTGIRQVTPLTAMIMSTKFHRGKSRFTPSTHRPISTTMTITKCTVMPTTGMMPCLKM